MMPIKQIHVGGRDGRRKWAFLYLNGILNWFIMNGSGIHHSSFISCHLAIDGKKKYERRNFVLSTLLPFCYILFCRPMPPSCQQ